MERGEGSSGSSAAEDGLVVVLTSHFTGGDGSLWVRNRPGRRLELMEQKHSKGFAVRSQTMAPTGYTTLNL
jgi:hypothetical protein